MAASLPTPFGYQQFDGDGSKTDFTFSFDYLLREHVKVFLDKTEVDEGTAADEFKWEEDKKIKMGTAPTASQKLTIIRLTPEDKQQVVWNDGSYLVAEDLNTSDKQWLYLLEEHTDYILRIIWGLPPVPGPGLPDDLFGLWNRLARNKDTNKGTSDEVATTIDKTDQLKGDASSPQNGEDNYVLTLGAISERLDLIKGDGSNYPGTGNTGQLGKLRVNSSNKLFYWDQSLSTPAWVEIVGGEKGADGKAATIEVDSTVTLDPGNDAKVTNTGTENAAKFKFEIPKGAKGDEGDTGPAPGLQDPATAVSNVALKADGSVGDATASVSQDADKKIKFTFGIPVGEKGEKGDKGDKGDSGTGGRVDEVVAGNGINVDNTTDTKPSVSVKAHTGITVNADGVAVTTPFSEPTDDNKIYGRRTNSGTSEWVEVTSGGGDVTGIDAGPGITVTDPDTATPKVSAAVGHGLSLGNNDTDVITVNAGTGITVDANGVAVTTPFSEPGSDGDFVRRRNNNTFTWETAPNAGVPDVSSQGRFCRQQDADGNRTWQTFTEGFADVNADGSFVRTRANNANSWTTAPMVRDVGTPNIVRPQTAADTLSTRGGPLLTSQVVDAVQNLNTANGNNTPNFQTSNTVRCSATQMTITAPTNPQVGQSGIFQIDGAATITAWANNYHFPENDRLTNKTGVVIIPFYVQTAGNTPVILMGAATEDMRNA